MTNQTPTQNTQMHLRIDAQLLSQAHHVARLTNQTLSEVVRTLLAAYVASEATK